jgi:tetratricopeptide (TPR) repeat protein
MALSKSSRAILLLLALTTVCFALVLGVLLATPAGRGFFDGASKVGEVLSDPAQRAETAKSIGQSVIVATSDSSMAQARSCFAAGRYRRALDLADRAASGYSAVLDAPGDNSIRIQHKFDAVKLRGDCQQKLGQFKLAHQSYCAALELAQAINSVRPTDRMAILRLANIYLDLAEAEYFRRDFELGGDYCNQALEEVDRLEAKFGSSYIGDSMRIRAYAMLGQLQFDASQNDKAKRTLELLLVEIAKLEPKIRADDKIWLYRTMAMGKADLGVIQEKCKHSQQAVKYYVEALQAFSQCKISQSGGWSHQLMAASCAEALADIEARDSKQLGSAKEHYKQAIGYCKQAARAGSDEGTKRAAQIEQTLESL